MTLSPTRQIVRGTVASAVISEAASTTASEINDEGKHLLLVELKPDNGF
jgi:hypothetical protein